MSVITVPNLARTPSVVVNAASGLPEPPSEVVRRLAAYDHELTVRYVKGVRGWAVCRRWADDDPRRLKIQQGEIDPASDYTILTFLPSDCSVDDAFGYIVQQARREAHDKDYWSRLCDALLVENEKHSDTIAEKALEEVSDFIDHGAGFGRSELPRVASGPLDNRPPTPIADGLDAIDRLLTETANQPLAHVTSTERVPTTGTIEIPAHWKREDGAEWFPQRKRWVLNGKMVAGAAPEEPEAPKEPAA